MKLKILKLLIIPFFLTLGYFILVAYPYFSSKISRFDSLGFLSVVEEQTVAFKLTPSSQRKTDKRDNHILAGEKVVSQFLASEDNLGIVLIRFVRFGIVSDRIVFRIKEEGKDWYYEHTYKADQFQDSQYFTFGFPPIAKSKNNLYVFELESLSGTYNNGVGVGLDEQKAAFVYKYTRDDLKNYKTLSTFIFKKLVYVARNVNFLQNWQIHAIFALSIFFVLIIENKKITIPDIIRFLPKLKKTRRNIFKAVTNKIAYLSKKATRWVTSVNFYLLFLNTNTKKRLAIGLLIFLLAFVYRYSSSLVNQSLLFYAGLGGQGDYDQFIRAATCAVKNFCPAILGQNFLIEASLLGVFYKIFGFTGGLAAYLYLMLILSSIVATLPHFLLSRKSWISVGGIIGAFFLATSDFLTQIALNFPPDNGSLFTFSMFYIVYLLTLHIGTIRWLLLFGLMGLLDGLNKALFLINDLAAFAIFAPVFFYEKVKSAGSEKKFASIFKKKNIKILFLSLIPLLVFLIIYIAWEYFVYTKFSAYYFLRGLIQSGGSSYISYTSLNDSSSGGNIILQLLYLCVSAVVMLKRLIAYMDIQILFMGPILLGLISFSFIKTPFDGFGKFTASKLRASPRRKTKKFILVFILSVALITLLTLVKNDYFKIHKIFEGEYILGTWTNETYIGIFLFCEIIFLFILNFKYKAIKLSLPIIPYVIMLIIMTKNSPFPRLSTHVVVWSVILFAYIIDWIIVSINGYWTKRIRFILTSLILILFFCVYMLPKMVTMITQLSSGLTASKNQVSYLRWVDSNIPSNAIVLAGGKSDLVTVAENVKRPIVYSTLWNAAVLIKPKEIPGVKATDFEIINQLKHTYNLKINQIQGVSPTDFSIIPELQNKDNFKRNTYIILEDDIYIWRARLTGAGDGIFTADLNSTIALHADDYLIKVYKFNTELKKAIYELNIRNRTAN